MSSRKYDLCKPFFDRDEPNRQEKLEAQKIEEAESIIKEYNDLDEEYTDYFPDDDWSYSEYIYNLSRDALYADFPYKDAQNFYGHHIFISELRSFKNFWINYTNLDNNSLCLFHN